MVQTLPDTETRGGERPDWDRAKPGKPLPEREDGESPGEGGA